MRLFALLASILLAASASAQELTKDTLTKFRDKTQTKEFKARQNATTNNSIGSMATSRENAEGQDRNFTHVIKRGRVTDQQKSGRCWMFAGFNVARYYVAQGLNVDDFEMSEAYLFFYHKLELSNFLLEAAITGKTDPNDPYIAWLLRNGLSDGGYWGMFIGLVEKYGAVPKSAMPETAQSSNTRELGALLDSLVKKHVSAIWAMRRSKQSDKAVRAYKEKALEEVYQFLALMFGTPPDRFTWRYTNRQGQLQGYRTDTPESFAREFVLPPLRGLVHLMNDPTLPYYRRYTLEGLKNVIEGESETFLNVPADVMTRAAQQSVMANQPVWFGSDVMAYADIKNGMLSLENYDFDSLLGVTTKMSKADRLSTYASAATHAMVLMGVDNNMFGMPVKWLVENSWGQGAGDGGYLVMTNDWLKEYGFDVIVGPSFVQEDIRAALDTPPTKLPLWHHLYRP